MLLGSLCINKQTWEHPIEQDREHQEGLRASEKDRGGVKHEREQKNDKMGICAGRT